MGKYQARRLSNVDSALEDTIVENIEKIEN